MVKTVGCPWAQAAGRTESTIAARQANVFLFIGKALSRDTPIPRQYIAAIVPDLGGFLRLSCRGAAWFFVVATAFSLLSLTCEEPGPKIADHWPSCLADSRVPSPHGASTASSSSTGVSPIRSKGHLLRI